MSELIMILSVASWLLSVFFKLLSNDRYAWDFLFLAFLFAIVSFTFEFLGY